MIGGGVIGLAAAWRLAAEPGTQVTVYDAATVAREASWAAAGMLAPHHESESCDDRWALGVASLARWPGFARQLGHDLDFRCAGGLVPALDAEDAAAAQHRMATLGVGSWIDGGELRRRESAVTTAALGALWLPAAQVDARRLGAALADACARNGVAIRSRCQVSVRERRLIVDGAEIANDLTVLAAGAWTPELAELSGIALSGEPVKGQMLRLAVADGLLSTFIHHPDAYLVARSGQGVVVGATMAWTGFDKAEDAAAIDRLASGARRLVPALASAPIAETWTGLRPRLHRGRPLIARIRPDLIIATGHFRNGILLTPITAEAVAALASGRAPPPEVLPFAFASGSTQVLSRPASP
ncbi:glycine oxidase ThiO [Planctomycetota bacterium]|nr:glycine oxidase ThiO [Planctomycetota bacterium]